MLTLHNIQITVLGSYGCSDLSLGYTKFFFLLTDARICDSNLVVLLPGLELPPDFLAWDCLLSLFLFSLVNIVSKSVCVYLYQSSDLEVDNRINL